MATRMRALLPVGWFADDANVVGGLLQGIGTAWSCVYQLNQFIIAQARILTATDIFLDMISQDFFGDHLPRFGLEQDSAFVLRIENEILRPRGTRAAIVLAVYQLTGRKPLLFEPRLASDTGGYTLGGVGYAVAGGWGNLSLPFQTFVSAYRPSGSGIASLAGYGSGGVPVYGALSMEPPQILDADIYAVVAAVLPAATVCWTRILN